VQALSEDIALLGESTSLSALDLEAIRERIETGKRTMNEIEIDMEKKEEDVRRQLFEANLKYIVFPPEV
jgi:transcriptional accessory protein Tex/SPT6